MQNIDKTIEELSLSRTSGDLWDEFNQTQNTSSLLLYLNSQSTFNVRFLGPFVGIYRFYAPFKRYGYKINIEAIANKDPDAIKEALSLFKNLSETKGDQLFSAFNIRHDECNTIIEYLSELDKKITWQKCIMVNVYVKGTGVKVLLLNRRLCDSIMIAAGNNPNVILNGLFAHDVSIKKQGEGIKTSFRVALKQQTYLSESDMNVIFGNGLIDIPPLIGQLNSSKTSCYYYKKIPNYRMASEFTKTLLEERSHMEENQHLSDVEEHLNEIPVEAFENRNRNRNAIGSLEVE